LREERRLRVFDNRLPRRIFGPKRDEVTRKWRKLNIEEVSDFVISTLHHILFELSNREELDGWGM